MPGGGRRGPKVRIWSAASSTGQEPYTIAMLIHEFAEYHAHLGVHATDFSILATDISSRVLSQAIEGSYQQFELDRGLDNRYLEKYFQQQGDKWVVKPELASMVEFRKTNLVQPISHLGAFDVIFCRNVLIYFDFETKKNIISQFHHMLNKDGLLILGASENLYTIDGFHSLTLGSTMVYKKKDG